VHYVSSLSVFPIVGDTDKLVIREHDSLDHDGVLYGGYTQSTWVSEKIVTLAGSRGLPVSIYRPGMISGHSQTGASNTEDFLSRLIKSWIECGYAPDLSAAVDMTPVDYVAGAIVHLSLSPQSLGKVFHLANQQPIPLNELVDMTRAFGYPIEPIPYDRWRAMLIDVASRSTDSAGYSLLPILLLKRAESASGLPRFDCQNALSSLSKSSIVCPPADARLLETYFSYFIHSGFIDPPPLKRAARGA
jgi:thioester reductase-like protein